MLPLICAPTPRELAALAPAIFPRPELIETMRPIKARLKRHEAIFLATGVGVINTALAIGFCLGLVMPRQGANARPEVDSILFTGLAAAFDLEVTPLCSICAVKEEIWPEYGLNDGTSVTAKAFSTPLWEHDNVRVYDRLELADLALLAGGHKSRGEDWAALSSLTVSGVTASFTRKNALWNTYHAALENMEGFAAAYVARRAEIPCVEIRVVANKVGPRSREEKDHEGAILAMSRILPSLNFI